MMKFRTEIEIEPFPDKIEYDNSLFFIGSCFASNIGGECDKKGLQVMINPFGVTYNPLSVIKILNYIDTLSPIEDAMYRKVGEKWCSLMHHSSFDCDTLAEIKIKTMDATVEAHHFIKKSSHLFITLGTSWVYSDNKNVNIVNNCHKISDKEFTRSKLSVINIVNNFSELLDNSKLLTNKKLIFTVSPIRHIKDSLIGNSLSKATLISAIGELCEKYPDRVFYFPAYEIMLDDLRDYRFYDDDMLHPNKIAIEYIYSVFEKTFLSSKTVDYSRAMEKIFQAMHHRAINPGSDAHKRFKKATLVNLLQIKKEYPLVDYDKWIEFFL